LNSVEGFISFITSNVAVGKFAFRRCGRDEGIILDMSREALGRKYVDYTKKDMEGKRVDLPMRELLRHNMMVDTLHRSIMEARSIRIRTHANPVPQLSNGKSGQTLPTGQDILSKGGTDKGTLPNRTARADHWPKGGNPGGEMGPGRI
jgi:hypothetical protein